MCFKDYTIFFLFFFVHTFVWNPRMFLKVLNDEMLGEQRILACEVSPFSTGRESHFKGSEIVL